MVTKKPKVVVVMPAYNAQHTIEKTWREVVAHDVVDLVIVVDDASKDDTAQAGPQSRARDGARASEEPRATAATRRPVISWRSIRAPTSS